MTAHHENQLHFFFGSLGHGFQTVRGVNLKLSQHVVGALLIKIFIEIGKIPDNIANPLVHIQISVIRQIGDMLLTLRADRILLHEDGTGGGGKQTVDHLDQSGFAASVRSEQADDVSVLNGEVNMVDGGFVAVTFGQIFTLQQSAHCFSPFIV